jgi:L-cysteate sulfo-lyase
LLEERSGVVKDSYALSGNALLNHLHGACVSKFEPSADISAEIACLANQLIQDGKTPYIIPTGGSDCVGALGYVNCARELAEQAADFGLEIDALVHATDSAGTQAGLLVGLAAIQSDIHLLGIGVRAAQDQQEQLVFNLAHRTAQHLGTGVKIARKDVHVNCGYVGAGYGLPSDGMVRSIKLLAQTEGLLFDPVYSGKGLDVLITLVKQGYFAGMNNVIFLHTGGTAALFGYPESMTFPDIHTQRP